MPTNKKEYMKEYMTQYYQKNAAVIKCDICGSEFKGYQKYKHRKTKKHLDALISGNIKANDKLNLSDDEIILLKNFLMCGYNKKQASDAYDSSQNKYSSDDE